MSEVRTREGFLAWGNEAQYNQNSQNNLLYLRKQMVLQESDPSNSAPTSHAIQAKKAYKITSYDYLLQQRNIKTNVSLLGLSNRDGFVIEDNKKHLGSNIFDLGWGLRPYGLGDL